MRDEIRADGERWLVRVEQSDERRDVRTYVFHCVSNSSRPYRVVQVPEAVVSERGVDAMGERELTDLFSRSHTMDYSHDVDAHPEAHGVDYRA
ncbi:MAG TPA: hypothetical protein VMN60_04465 [Longimicrobiales bacterium]|nr:hypothetical protein [Longimicrobiales bacterium]